MIRHSSGRRGSATATILIPLLVGLLIVSTMADDKAEKSKVQEGTDKFIAVTFDELPASMTFEDPDYMALSYLVLQALENQKVKATGFVVGQNTGSNYDILGEWLNRGHKLGNLTWSNQDLNELGIEQFIHSIRKGGEELEEMLVGFGQKKRYFRYPYFRYGTSTEAKRQVELFLDHHGYTTAHASVIPEDYLYNLTLQKLGREPDSIAFETLLNEYINHVLDEIERCETVGKRLTGRTVVQILSLRLNRLNAVFVEEMLTAIRDMGYTFVSLDKALTDDVYSRPEGYFGGRGVGYLDMLALSDPDRVPAE